jgi:hypothetical protein
VNAVYWDEWNFVPLVMHSMNGHLSFSELWAQHNEDRVLFPNLLAIAIVRLTRWNDFAFYSASAALLAATVGIIIRAMWRDIRLSPLLFVFIPLVGFTLVQYENTLWAFQIAWFIVLFCLVATVALLARPVPLSWQSLTLAVIFGVIGSYSSLQGLLVWPVGFIVLLAKGRANRIRALWVGVGVLVAIGYFHNYSKTGAGILPLSDYFHNVATTTRAFLLAIGNIIPSAHLSFALFGLRLTISPSYAIQETIGAILAAGGVLVVVLWFIDGRPGGARAFSLGLVLIGLGFNVLLIPSRLYNDLLGGLPSRYTTMTWPLVLGVFLGLVARRAPTSARSMRTVMLKAAALALVVLQVVLATMSGIANGQTQASIRRTSADVLANLRAAPSYLVEPYLFPPSAAYVDGLEPFLAKNHMNIFEGTTAASLQKLGIVPGGQRLPLVRQPATVETWTRADPRALEAWMVLSDIYAESGGYLGQYVTQSSSYGLVGWAYEQPPISGIALSPWYPPPAAVFLAPYARFYAAWEAQQSWHSYAELPVPSSLKRYLAAHPEARLAWNIISGVYANTPSLQAEFPARRGRRILEWAGATGSLSGPSATELIPLRRPILQMLQAASASSTSPSS